MHRLRLRSSEWVLLAFFVYIAAVTPFFQDRPHLGYQPAIVLIAVFALFSALALRSLGPDRKAVEIVRDWLPIPLTLAAFREMELFVPLTYTHVYEQSWIRWDIWLLDSCHLHRAIQAAGALIPSYLELCYFFVYAVGAYCVAILYLRGHRTRVNQFLTIYLLGTLSAYAMFPFFPSEPPRFAFPTIAPPIDTWIRDVNLWFLRHATIHSGVFPSAHVSSAFSCAWAMFLVLPERKRFGWGLLFYALSVSVATVYGRYHYAADVAAGFGVSLAAGVVGLFNSARRSRIG
jgi:membrane-associated phospholipid phosphatase